MRNTRGFFIKLVDSIALEVCRHREVKRGICLILVGGVHISICAKSQFLKSTLFLFVWLNTGWSIGIEYLMCWFIISGILQTLFQDLYTHQGNHHLLPASLTATVA
jgi:hypothetical protein